MTLSDKQKLLYDAMSGIDDQYIEEAFERPRQSMKKKAIWWSGLAAGLVLVVLLHTLLPHFAPTLPQDSSPTDSTGRKPGLNLEEIFQDGGFFAITAYAAETGQEEVYRFNNTYRNFVYSSPNERQEFEGVDVLFSFFLQRPLQKPYGNQLIFEYNDVVSCNKDTDHIHTMDVSSWDENGQVHNSIYFTGWFDKPTDLTITMLNPESNQILQKVTLHIEFDEEENVYLLTVTEHYMYKEET